MISLLLGAIIFLCHLEFSFDTRFLHLSVAAHLTICSSSSLFAFAGLLLTLDFHWVGYGLLLGYFFKVVLLR